jgi:hypothetical protein
VAYLDLDGFKPVNDRFGHGVGDRLLVEMARRLQAASGHRTWWRGSGRRVRDPAEPARAARIARPAQPPDAAHGRTRAPGRRGLTVTASIGLTLYPDDDADADTLLRHADQAMYLAKQAGRNRIHLFDAERERASREHHPAGPPGHGAAGRRVLPARAAQGGHAGRPPGRRRGPGALAAPRARLLGPGEFLPQIEGSALEAPLANGCWRTR